MRRGECCAGGAKLGFGIRKRALALVEIALRDGAVVGKPAATVEFRFRKADLGFGRGDLSFSAGNSGLIGGRIDGEEGVAFLHQRAFAKMHSLDLAGDAGANLHPVNGFQTAGKFLPAHHVAAFNLGNGDRDRWCFSRRGSGRCIATGGEVEKQCCCCNGHGKPDTGARQGPALCVQRHGYLLRPRSGAGRSSIFTSSHDPDVKPLRTFTGHAQNAKFQWFNWSTKVLNSEQTDETHPPPSP